MIISCINCYKKFDLDQDLIPENGRLLVCGSCNHQWFFKKKIPIHKEKTDDSLNFEASRNIKSQEKDLSLNENEPANPKLFNKLSNDKITVEDSIINKKLNKFENKKSHKKPSPKNFSFLKITVVLIISFIALIILVDTFQYYVSKIFPKTEIIHYNLYESIKDIKLFFKDLIQ
jgi:predicted Zn finger-like uncharacterized protein